MLHRPIEVTAELRTILPRELISMECRFSLVDSTGQRCARTRVSDALRLTDTGRNRGVWNVDGRVLADCRDKLR